MCAPGEAKARIRAGYAAILKVLEGTIPRSQAARESHRFMGAREAAGFLHTVSRRLYVVDRVADLAPAVDMALRGISAGSTQGADA